VKTLESNLGSLLGANGALYALRRNLYFPLSKYRGDDFELPVGVLLRGYEAILDRSAKAFEKVPYGIDGVFRQKVRIISWVWKSALILCWKAILHRKPLVLFQIISHKILRWLTPVFMIGIFAANLFLTGSFWFALLFALQCLFYALSVTGILMLHAGIRRLPPLLRVTAYFVVVHVAALVALVQALTGRTTNTWEKIAN